MNAAKTVAAPRLTHYLPHWLAVVGLISALVYCLFRLQVDPVPGSPRPVDSTPNVNWFFMVQLPHVVTDAGAQAYGFNLERRLQGLLDEGFQPMLLSEIIQRLKKGHPLPRNTVALFYEQGYRETIEAAWPTVQTMRVPVTLLTPFKPIEKGDWGYISHYRAYTLRRGGLWDIGYFDGESPKRLTLWSKEDRPIWMGPSKGDSFWETDPNGSVLNQGAPLERLRRIYFNPQWTPADLANRLRAEIPVEGPSRLSTRSIVGRQWGVTLPLDSNKPEVFTLHAEPTSRTCDVTWLGTQKLSDVELEARADRIHGEWWFLLRSTQDKDIRVGFLTDAIVVDTLSPNGEHRQLFRQEAARAEAPSYRIHLKGSLLTLYDASGNELAPAIQLPADAGASAGSVRMLIYDRFYGAALGESIQLAIKPLSPPQP